MPRHQQSTAHSVSPQLRMERRVLGGAFLRIATLLPKAPDRAWYERSREESRRALHPCDSAVRVCRVAMRAAIETDSDEVIRETRLLIEAYFAECANAATDVGPGVFEERVSLTDVVSASCGAIDALVQASQTQSPGFLDKARTSGRRVRDFFDGWLRDADARQRESSALEMWS